MPDNGVAGGPLRMGLSDRRNGHLTGVRLVVNGSIVLRVGGSAAVALGRRCSTPRLSLFVAQLVATTGRRTSEVRLRLRDGSGTAQRVPQLGGVPASLSRCTTRRFKRLIDGFEYAQADHFGMRLPVILAHAQLENIETFGIQPWAPDDASARALFSGPIRAMAKSDHCKWRSNGRRVGREHL